MNQISHLLALADEFKRIKGVEDKTLSFWVFGDSKKLSALRAGADITTKRFSGALNWFASNWPDSAQWPSEIDRPAVAA